MAVHMSRIFIYFLFFQLLSHILIYFIGKYILKHDFFKNKSLFEYLMEGYGK